MTDKRSTESDWQYCFVGVDFDTADLEVSYRNTPGKQSYRKRLQGPDSWQIVHDIQTQLERDGWILDKESGGGQGTFQYYYKRPSPR